MEFWYVGIVEGKRHVKRENVMRQLVILIEFKMNYIDEFVLGSTRVEIVVKP